MWPTHAFTTLAFMLHDQMLTPRSAEVSQSGWLLVWFRWLSALRMVSPTSGGKDGLETAMRLAPVLEVEDNGRA